MSRKITPTTDRVAEEATGISQRGDCYPDGYAGWKEAAAAFLAGDGVHVVAAGAGSYKRVLESLGCRFVEVYDWTSSAGDWTFVVQDAYGRYRLAFQSNRYPRYGFRYGLGSESFDTVEDLRDFAAQ